MNRQLPSLSALKAFEAAARLGSFKLAAETLNLSTSAISHQIRTLETRLGKALFDRHNNGVTLTLAGNAYLKTVRTAFDQLERGTLAIMGNHGGSPLKISLLATLSTLWLIPRLDSFRTENPKTNIEFVDNPEIIDFKSSTFDAAIRYDFSGRQSWGGLIVHPLVEEYLFPVCSPDYLRAYPEVVSLEWNERHTLLLNSRHPDEWVKWGKAVAMSTDLAKHSNSSLLDTSSMTLMAARNGLGIAMARTPFVDQFVDDASLVRVHPKSISRGVRHFLVYPPENANNPDLIRFRDWLINLAAKSNAGYQRTFQSPG